MTVIRTPHERSRLAQYVFLAPWCKEQTVMVIGCDTGQGVHTLAQHGAAWVDALDTDALTIQHARRHFAHEKVAYHVKSGDSVVMNKTYQRILCLNLLERVNAPEPFITNLFQHLSDTGQVAVSVERQVDNSLDYQALRTLLTPYFPYQHVYYINQHLGVSIAGNADSDPLPQWLTADRQLDVNDCEALLLVVGKQAFQPQALRSILAVDAHAYLDQLSAEYAGLKEAYDTLEAATLPREHQLKAAYQTQLSLEAELHQTRDQVLASRNSLHLHMQQVRPLLRFSKSPLLTLHRRTRWLGVKARQRWRKGVSLGHLVQKPTLPAQLTLPWVKAKSKAKPSLQADLSWKNAPIEQLLHHELDWLKQRAARQKLKAGFGKVLVILPEDANFRWQAWQEAFDVHGLTMGLLPLTALAADDSLLSDWQETSLVILHQLPFSETVKGLVNGFRNRNIPVVYDAATLACDPTALLQDDAFTLKPRLEREMRINTAERLRLTREHCDYCLTENQPLALRLKTEDTPAYIAPTPVSYAQRVLADVLKHPQRFFADVQATRLWLQLDPEALRLSEIQMVSSSLVKLLLRYPTLTVTVSGQWQQPTELAPFEKRLTILAQPPSLLEAMRQLAFHDIMLLPVRWDAPTRSTHALACQVRLAALVGVPTVASPADSLTAVIQDGLNGHTAKTPEEWVAHVSHLIEQPNVRENQSRQALNDSIQAAYVENQLSPLITTFEHLLTHYEHNKHPEKGRAASARLLNNRNARLDVAVAFTLPEDEPFLSLATACRLNALLDLGYYLTLYVLSDKALVDLRPRIEKQLGRDMGRYHLTRLNEAVHPHDVCVALDWQALEAAQTVQSRFAACIRWVDQLEADDAPMGLTRLRIEQTCRNSNWLHVTDSAWLAEQLKRQYGTTVHALAPWVSPVPLRPIDPHQRLLIVHNPADPGHCTDWLMAQLAAIKARHPGWTVHLMGPLDPKTLPFDITHYPLAQTLLALNTWLATGDILLTCTTGAPLPVVITQALANGLPVVDISVTGREDRYDSSSPVLQLPMASFASQLSELMGSTHIQLHLAEQGRQYTMESAITLDSQLSLLLQLAQPQQLSRL